MPKSLAIRQLLDCSEQEFWDKIFRNENFNRYLYEGLGFDYELLEWNAKSGYRKARVWPGQQMPRPLSKVFGERFSYTEEGTYDPIAERYQFRVIPSAMPERIRAFGSVVVEGLSERQCERRVSLEISADVLGLGRVIETYLVATTRQQYAMNAALVNEYLSGFR